jgi:hypothetical protein
MTRIDFAHVSREQLVADAQRLLEDNPRHTEESLYVALDAMYSVRLYPEVTETDIQFAIKAAL